MRYEGVAVLTMFQDMLSEIVITELLVETYTKIYSGLSTLNKVLFDDNYTLDEDFYILNSTVTAPDKESIKTLVMTRYNNWSNGYPDSIGSDIMFAVYNKSWSDNLENNRKQVMKAVHIFAKTDCYNELEIIADKIKSIRIYEDIEEVERTYNTIEFLLVESSGQATKYEDTFIEMAQDIMYYPIEIIFDMVYTK